MVIRQIGVGSLAKILAALYAFWGFIFGAILALAAMVGAGIGAGNDNAMPVWFGGIFGLARSSSCRSSTAALALSAARSPPSCTTSSREWSEGSWSKPSNAECRMLNVE